MPPEQASEDGTDPKAVLPAPEDSRPDGDTSSVPAKRSRARRSSRRTGNKASATSAKKPEQQRPPSAAGVRGQDAPPASRKRAQAADWESLTVQPARRRLALEPREWARFGLYAAVIVLAASLAGYLFGTLGNTMRAARSEVLYELQADQPSGNLRQDRQLTTQLVTVRSRDVLGPAAEKHGLTVQELSDKLVVGIAEDSEVVRIEVHDPSASRARSLVGAITREYLAHARPTRAAEARQYLEGQLADVDNRLAALRSATPSSLEPTQSTVEQQSLIAQRSELQSRLEDVTVEEIREPRVEEITKGYTLPDPVSGPRWRPAAVGAAAGLMVAAAAIALLVRRRTSTPHGA
jgi:hypothetical protein